MPVVQKVIDHVKKRNKGYFELVKIMTRHTPSTILPSESEIEKNEISFYIYESMKRAFDIEIEIEMKKPAKPMSAPKKKRGLKKKVSKKTPVLWVAPQAPKVNLLSKKQFNGLVQQPRLHN
ncbi:hypothetical protein L5515_012089 [Caenorhabditis briggsae]|uniref:Uncharacterized protein n=1 Tax=Caenorhabditis briggsae TaxID=6238 RepID=A0AAE9JHD2_CAEBR|nr:hypothetical protein L5515_012089 [Caenorhabditis briggsae]